jgi:hypothetical protein
MRTVPVAKEIQNYDFFYCMRFLVIHLCCNLVHSCTSLSSHTSWFWGSLSAPLTWKDMPGCRHSKLFISRLCKVRVDDLLKLNRYQLKLAVAFLTGHAPLRGHLCTIGLFNGDPSCRFCRMETETAQHIICSCEALSHQCYNVFGKPLVEPREINTASVRDLCLFIRVSGLLNLCWNT